MEEVHYIWITWKSVTGSSSALLWKNGNFPLEDAKSKIDMLCEEALIDAAPRWVSPLSEISIHAKNIRTGKVLYRRTIAGNA